MKIAFFLPALSFGGIEANTIRLAKSFIEKGYDIELLLGRAQGEYLERIDKSLKVINFNKKRSIGMIYSLVRYMKKEKPDIVYTGGEQANIILMLAKLLSPKTKVIISIRTNLTVEYKETERIIKKKLYPLLSKYLYKLADSIVTVSKGVADDVNKFLNLPKSKLTVIYNPIIDDEIFNLMEQRNSHPWLNDDQYKVIVSVGRLVNQKNFSLLIKAFKKVKEQLPEAKLIILGEGPEKQKLKYLIEELEMEKDVTLEGFVQNPYSYMKKSDLFVLSSKWEGFGNVIVEALATGTPVVSTKCPSGPDEILENGKFGYLVNLNDVEQMSTAILHELSTPSADEKKRKARAEKFSVESATIQYIKLMKNLIQR